ncbi:hypothetical protein COV19_02135 [Candidatus Woesearchaeota archaeon CG10_big_fil_rev_8_21_14_0_10_44_13]|nr:MAG: hypothetical protein COV19_02135 [Candidatus Woesearchaeota archaeon CG10_big_fil_rev_8_21_14_0_10_44_13]
MNNADSSRIQVIKIGSKCIFGMSGLDYETIRKRAREIQEMGEEGTRTILVVSGAIALGKHKCFETRANDDIESIALQRYACIGQPELVRFYTDAFEGIYTVSQLLVTKKDVEQEHHVRERILDDVQQSIVTLINYNDGVDFEELRKDNDTLASTIARYISAQRLVILGKYDGMKDKKGGLITEINEVNDELYRMCNGVSNDGTGGFQTKLDAAKMLMQSGIEMVISNIGYSLHDVVSGKVQRTHFRR